MKMDIFNHIFPKAYFDRMVRLAPDGKDMHKRVRAIPSIIDLEERFRIMDKFQDYVQIICLPQGDAVSKGKGIVPLFAWFLPSSSGR
jgi:aminocarboxymuconate-semialdehyde decarboxylase